MWVKLYGVNDRGIPAEWPEQVIESGDYPGPPWVMMSRAEYDLHRLQHQAAYDAWEASQPEAQEDDVLATQKLLFPRIKSRERIFAEIFYTAQQESIDVMALLDFVDKRPSVMALLDNNNYEATKLRLGYFYQIGEITEAQYTLCMRFIP